jgi:TetR/AcrR family transcriptional repressor of mexJK operon
LDKLQAILDAANALFLERGIAATTMESVAERACVSKMTVYGHFRDKASLLSAVERLRQ